MFSGISEIAARKDPVAAYHMPGCQNRLQSVRLQAPGSAAKICNALFFEPFTIGGHPGSEHFTQSTAGT